MVRFIKRLMGYLIIINFVPLLCVAYAYGKDYNLLEYYFIGLCGVAIFYIFTLIGDLLIYLLND